MARPQVAVPPPSGLSPSEVHDGSDPGKPVSRFFTISVIVLALALFASLIALGTWQVQRRAWKLDLIERVEQRVHAAPVAAPERGQWPKIKPAIDEYRHVRLTGTFLHDRETLVQASTVQGSGFWVLTPLQAADGTTVLVNRGFVLPELRDRAARAPSTLPGEASVAGLLRITEPGGGFLRKNDAKGNRWYSRDVQAIAAAQGLQNVAPFFVDADASSPAPGQSLREAPEARQLPEPQGGLTVISFYNNHLVYALTWYGLALMVLGGAWVVLRERRR